MAVVSRRLRVVYFDITKVGSSTVKRALWEFEHGRPFPGRGIERVVNILRGRLARAKLVKPRNIHEMPGYRTMRFELAEVPEGFETFTLVRDPASRLKSAWRDKIHRAQFQWRGEVEDLEAEGLPTDPTFGQLIDNFEEYRMISRPVRVHTTPYSWHLGPDLGAFDEVFRIEEFARLQTYLDARAGGPFAMPRRNESGPAARDDRLTDRQIDKLFEITGPDYGLLGGLYDIDRAKAAIAGDRAGRADPVAKVIANG